VTSIIKPRWFLVNAQKSHGDAGVTDFPEGSQAKDVAQEYKYAPLDFSP
jgi:hypothetical protein